MAAVEQGALEYLSGFGNEHASEAERGALPVGQNSPQHPPLGLYAEQLSGTAFTVPNCRNRRTWMYRIRPSVRHASRFTRVTTELPDDRSRRGHVAPIGQIRWDPPPFDDEPRTWMTGLRTVCTNGDVNTQEGMAALVYMANESMSEHNAYACNNDGELLIVPQDGRLRVRTECGQLDVGPGEICVIPRGMVFAIDLHDKTARGYVCENYGEYLELPERGPIGANGLANSRDFQFPVAAYEDVDLDGTMTVKFGGHLHRVTLRRSPLDVVAWHGNHAPYVYDLRRFNTMGTVSFDHPDPSIYTVLTAPSGREGVANVDFVIFPDRWLVAENTFRPPWYHRNFMSEFMGLIYGEYDAKATGFLPGGMSLHNSWFAHGPDNDAWVQATGKDLQPEKLTGTLAFMFETRYPLVPSTYANELPELQDDYPNAWEPLERRFRAPDSL